MLDLDEDEFSMIISVIESFSDDEEGRLKPAYEALDEVYDYSVLRCIQATMM